MTQQEFKELEARVLATQKAVVELEKDEKAALDNKVLTKENVEIFEKRTDEVIEMCWNNLTGPFGKVRDNFIKNLKHNLKVLKGGF